jgi:SAM-dependent MidA family methyltransferase
MAGAFAAWRYVPVEIERGSMPSQFRGVVFSNEFFDALPVQVVKYERGEFREQRVAFTGGRFQWTSAELVTDRTEKYLRAYYAPPEEGRCYEMSALNLWMERIAESLAEGWVLTIDYGFTREESVRFPQGTLMSYHRHTALDDVLADPGERDITAHVNFTAMSDLGRVCGLAKKNFQTLAQMMLTAGEADQFAAALGTGLGSGDDEPRRRLQLKTLLFGMGETYRVLLQRRDSNRSEVSEI